MELSTEKLQKQEQKYSAELETALAEFDKIRKWTDAFGELVEERMNIRSQKQEEYYAGCGKHTKKSLIQTQHRKALHKQIICSEKICTTQSGRSMKKCVCNNIPSNRNEQGENRKGMIVMRERWSCDDFGLNGNFVIIFTKIEYCDIVYLSHKFNNFYTKNV